MGLILSYRRIRLRRCGLLLLNYRSRGLNRHIPLSGSFVFLQLDGQVLVPFFTGLFHSFHTLYQHLYTDIVIDLIGCYETDRFQVLLGLLKHLLVVVRIGPGTGIDVVIIPAGKFRFKTVLLQAAVRRNGDLTGFKNLVGLHIHFPGPFDLFRINRKLVFLPVVFKINRIRHQAGTPSGAVAMISFSSSTTCAITLFVSASFVIGPVNSTRMLGARVFWAILAT